MSFLDRLLNRGNRTDRGSGESEQARRGAGDRARREQGDKPLAAAAGDGDMVSRERTASGSTLTPAGELILHNGTLNTVEALAEHAVFHTLLSSELRMGAHLLPQICPVEVVKSSKQVLLLVTAKQVGSPQLAAVIKALAQNKYRLRPGPQSNLFVVNSPLLLAISRGQLQPSALQTERRIRSNEGESNLWNLFRDLVTWARHEDASDIHVNIMDGQERSAVRFHIGGMYVGPQRWVLPTSTLLQMLGLVWQKANGGAQTSFVPTMEQEARVIVDIKDTSEQVMLRWASLATDDGPHVTMRLVRLNALQDVTSLEHLGYLPSQVVMLRRAMKSGGGAIVFAGKVGSGKSTTIATTLSGLPDTQKLITLEDPREYVIPRGHSKTVSRRLDDEGAKDPFAPAMLIVKRHAPDVIFIGEIRDPVTGAAFQNVVTSGQLLYTTTHAPTAMGIVNKLASPAVGIGRDVLSTPGHLRLLVYQALLPMTCKHCRINGQDVKAHPVAFEGMDIDAYIGRFERLFGIGADKLYFRNPKGCQHCARAQLPELNGFHGRTVVAEMYEPDDEMLELIANGNTLGLQRYADSLLRTGYSNPDMTNKPALECAIYKVSVGEVDPREVETRFESFETIELRRQTAQLGAERRARDASLLRRRATDVDLRASAVGGRDSLPGQVVHPGSTRQSQTAAMALDRGPAAQCGAESAVTDTVRGA